MKRRRRSIKYFGSFGEYTDFSLLKHFPLTTVHPCMPLPYRLPIVEKYTTCIYPILEVRKVVLNSCLNGNAMQ